MHADPTPAATLPRYRFEARTVPALLAATARRAPERTFLRFLDPARPGLPPRELTFAAFRELVGRAAAFLAGAGVRAGDRVLLLAENSPEWQAVALGAQLLRAEPAALFASLAPAPALEQARRVGPRACFVSGRAQWEKLAPAAADLAAGGLAAVLTGAPLGPGASPVPVTALRDALGAGAPGLATAELEARAAAVREDDPYLLLFTSGTGGRQKGVRLAQRAIVHAVDGGAGSVGTTDADLGIHLLPFGHVAGHDQFVLALAQGHGLVLAARREELPAALALGPTYLFAVPLVYERIREKALAGVARLPPPLRALVRAALAAGARVRVDGARGPADRALAGLAELLVGRRLRRRLGGRLRAVYAGGAPASAALFRFFEGLGLPFVELYGMSETAGLISSNLLLGPRRPGVAGLPSADHELRFAEDGELLLRGPLLFSGYLDPADDRDALEDGWFHTGDLVRRDDQGMLVVTGRKKDLLVLSTGKKVAPEPVELALGSAPPFLGAVLVGEGLPFASAVVFVEQAELSRLAMAGAAAAAALLPRARAALDGFSEHERPKRLVVIPGAPQDHPELVTPTLKVKRRAVLAAAAEELRAVYAR